MNDLQGLIPEKEIRVLVHDTGRTATTCQFRSRSPTLHTDASASTTTVTATFPPSHYRIMARSSKRKQLSREKAKENVRQRKVRKIQEERGWESSEAEDVMALGLLQRSADQERADSVSESEESENEEVLVSKKEELEEVDGSNRGKLMASAVERSMCAWFLKMPGARTDYL